METVEDMLKIMSPNSRKNKSQEHGMLNLVEVSLQTELLRQNMPQIFIDELVTAAVRTNYGQMPFQGMTNSTNTVKAAQTLGDFYNCIVYLFEI